MPLLTLGALPRGFVLRAFWVFGFSTHCPKTVPRGRTLSKTAMSTRGDPAELAKAIETYFASDLFRNLKVRRPELKECANANHSRQAVAELTRNAYVKMLGRNPS
jgi:hypothetical protein